MKQHKSPSRRHFLAFSVAGLALATAACSKTETAAVRTAAAGTAIDGGTALFGTGVSHQLSLSWNEDDYQGMIDAYGTDSSKEWISADLTIDGVLIKNVGVRLKGNSTLRTLGGSGGMGGKNFPDGAPNGGTRPTDMPTGAAGRGGGNYPGGMGGGMGASNGISADVPQSLPLLIRFDKYVKGTKYQGLTELALRPGSPVINEALALGLTAATGQASQRFAYASYSVNGSETQSRLLLENPAEDYADALDNGKTVLFKADSESSFSYQGDDKATYEEQFKQLNQEDTQDLAPIIDFLKWLGEADDATFEAQLANWVDVPSFARYTATQNLLANTDDMAGPGQNYYLGYNVETKLLTVISWDLNMAMSSNATASPEQSLTMGGGGSGGRGGNPLKSRFLAAASFKKLYDSAYVELYSQMYSSGKALELLEQITASIPSSDALTSDSIATSSATVKAFAQKRTESLKSQLPAA
ncbi:spore coat protein CotH [Arthrobacter stackebrandtii]|uniref:Spore coat protein CotH n=1 Tax=Arthrobacter stackebrandtii TaxID=272161 RepID=A0ABS4YVP9_9MICC|nr:CotH kinase family protein [Arthrobacter stackebrandtii]MBP2412846.1 spore coat protein CotH [Arthrobacter stackebrandtii]PYH01336.1 spore coat protein CotH [Arthrobacter stackebrandtii]